MAPSNAQALLDATAHALRVAGYGSSSHEQVTTGLAGITEPDLEGVVDACRRAGMPVSLCADELSEELSTSGALVVPLQGVDAVYAVLSRASQGDPKVDQIALALFYQDGRYEENSGSLSQLGLSLSGSTYIKIGAAASCADNKEPGEKPCFTRWLWSILWQQRSSYRDVLLASFLINLFVIASPLFVMNIYDRVVPNEALETLWVLTAGVLLVFVFDLVIKLLRHQLLERSARRTDLVLSSKLFAHTLNLRASSFPGSVGAFVSQFREFDAIKNFISATTITSLIDLPFAILFLIIIYGLGGGVAWVPLLAGFVIIVYGFVLHFPVRRSVREYQQQSARKNAVLVESLSALETIKTFNAEARYQQKWEDCNQQVAETSFRLKRLGDSISMVSGFVIQIAVAAVVVVSVYQISFNQMSLGALIACVLLTPRALAPMSQVATLVAQFYQAKSALTGLNSLSLLPSEHSSQSRYIGQSIEHGRINFDGVDFRYQTGKRVLSHIDLSIEAGEKVALIGKIGSGKSSLFRLLLGLERPEAGMLTIDGLDICQLDPSRLRERIAYVPQDAVLVSGTLRDNLLLQQKNADNARLMEIIQKVGLMDLVNQHAMGLDLPIGERGQGLSGGQRQAVAIARALLGDPRILMCDELTSAMDNQTESQIIDFVADQSRDKTLVISTHRASLLKLVDRIVVLDKGKIVADGPKEQVLEALKRGLVQTGGQAPGNGAAG